MAQPNQRNLDAIGDTDAPGVITNANAKKQLEEFMAEYDANVTPVTATQKVAVVNQGVEASDNEKRISLIKAKVAPDCTNTEFELLMYMADKYNLDPLLRQIWAVKFGNSPAQIYAGRDGFLEIAHRSGMFNGMDTKVIYKLDDEGRVVTDKSGLAIPHSAVCTVWRKDMTNPFIATVLFTEYNTGKNLWTSKPSVMIGKVAESVCLRKAFSVSGLYCPEEMGRD